MAKITIAGDVAVITSSKTLEQLKQVEKNYPDALKLRDDDGRCYFAIGTGSESVNKNGISFNGATHDGHGLAYTKFCIPKDTADAKDYVADYVGTSFLNLQRVEKNLDIALSKIKEDKAEVLKNIVNTADAESSESQSDSNQTEDTGGETND